jgi:HK97 family phage portal protein
MWNPFKKNEKRSKSLDQLLALNNLGGSGQYVSANTSESIPAVYCAVATIADAVATLPIHLYKRINDGKQRANSHHVEQLLDESPNSYQTPFELKQTLMRAVLLYGNGYLLIVHDNSGRAIELHNINPTACTPVRLSQNRIGYKYTDEQGKQHALHYEEILHIKHASEDGINGRSPITVCRDNLGMALSMQEHGSNVMKNGVYAQGILTTDSVFSDDNAIQRLKEQWKEYSGSSSSGKTPILENGLKYQALSMTNSDLQFLESRNLSIADIARMFKISPMMLQDLSNGTYSNFAESNRAFLSNTLRPWLTNLQQGFVKALIPNKHQSQYIIEFNTKDLLRANTQERFESYDIAIRNGIICPNEARAAENMQPRADGDDYSQSWLNQLSQAEHEKQ